MSYKKYFEFYELPIEAFKPIAGRMSLHFGGGDKPAPAPTNTSTTQTTLGYPKEVMPFVMEAVNRALPLASQGYQAYTGEQVAGFDPLQLQAQQRAANMQPSQNIGAASQMAGLAGLKAGNVNYDPMAYQASRVNAPQLQSYQMQGPANIGTGSFTDPGVASQYMSPYQQNVTDINKREALRQYGVQQTQLQGDATRQGAFGGGRQAILQNELNRSMNQNLADIQNRGTQDAFAQGQDLYSAEAQRRLQAAQANQSAGLQTGQQNLQAMLGVQELGAGQGMTAQQANQQASLAAAQAQEQSRQYGAGLGLQGNQQALAAAQQLGELGQADYNQQTGIMNNLNTIGAQRQGLQQQKLSQDQLNFQNQQRFPYEQLAWFNEMLKGAPQQTTAAMYQAPPSAAAQIAGLGAAAAGAALRKNGGLAGLGLYNMSKGK
jgi:hypothetical protein